MDQCTYCLVGFFFSFFFFCVCVVLVCVVLSPPSSLSFPMNCDEISVPYTFHRCQQTSCHIIQDHKSIMFLCLRLTINSFHSENNDRYTGLLIWSSSVKKGLILLQLPAGNAWCGGHECPPSLQLHCCLNFFFFFLWLHQLHPVAISWDVLMIKYSEVAEMHNSKSGLKLSWSV